MPKPSKYEFTLPDGSKRYEIVCDRSDIFVFQQMHGAVSAKRVRQSSGAA